MDTAEIKAERKPRKANVLATKVAIIQDKVEENLDTLQSKFTTNVTNKKKSDIWIDITKEVNAAGVSPRTAQEVKDKWKNMATQAKKKQFSSFRRESRNTGGGPAPKKPSETTEKIIAMFEDKPSFCGLQGFDSGKNCFRLIM